jgi:hypothetical protein
MFTWGSQRFQPGTDYDTTLSKDAPLSMQSSTFGRHPRSISKEEKRPSLYLHIHLQTQDIRHTLLKPSIWFWTLRHCLHL